MKPEKDVVITVSGGVADCYSHPLGITVEIVDYDNLNDGDGTGDENCPCQHGPDRCSVCEEAGIK